jgi:hypothetical protein
VASITLIEVYGCKNLSPEEKEALDTVFARLIVYDLDQEVIDGAIRLRQARRMRLGDSIIAATALCHGLRLARTTQPTLPVFRGLSCSIPCGVSRRFPPRLLSKTGVTSHGSPSPDSATARGGVPFDGDPVGQGRRQLRVDQEAHGLSGHEDRMV